MADNREEIIENSNISTIINTPNQSLQSLNTQLNFQLTSQQKLTIKRKYYWFLLKCHLTKYKNLIFAGKVLTHITKYVFSQVFSERERECINEASSTDINKIKICGMSYKYNFRKFKSYVTKMAKIEAQRVGIDKDTSTMYTLCCLDILSILSDNFNTMRIHVTPNILDIRYPTTEHFTTYQSFIPENGVVYHTTELVFAKNVHKNNYKDIINELGIYVPQEYSDDIYSYLSLILTDKEKEQYNFK